MTDKEHIDKIIANTFTAIKEVFRTNKEQNGAINDSVSRLIFPSKRKGETRISEQELRMVFVEQFNKYVAANRDWNVFYSVETPTMDTYADFSKNPHQDDDGRSGNIDLSIHNVEGKRICLIEFKALNPDKIDYEKDFVKLNNKTENVDLTYFVQIVDNHDSGTYDNIVNKKTINIGKVNYRCLSLSDGKEITEW